VRPFAGEHLVDVHPLVFKSVGAACEIDLPDAEAFLPGGGDRLVAIGIDPVRPFVAGPSVMTAQRLDVGHLHAGLRHLAQDEGNMRQLTIREHVAMDEFPPMPTQWLSGTVTQSATL